MNDTGGVPQPHALFSRLVRQALIILALVDIVLHLCCVISYA